MNQTEFEIALAMIRAANDELKALNDAYEQGQDKKQG